MKFARQNRLEIIRPWLVMASVILAAGLVFAGCRMFDLSLPGPARTLRELPEKWSMRLAAAASLLTAQAVLIGALPLIWQRRPLHGSVLKTIGVVVVLASVASLSLAFAS